MRKALFRADAPPISRLGMGGWQAGGSGPWGGGPLSDDRLAIAAIRQAVEGGVTWVDTAASYGLGHSEEVVARALAPWRMGEDVLVFTKCGHPWDPPDRIRTDLRPASIRVECEASLRRLGVERIDLYQFHHADAATPIEESWAAMAQLADEGKIRWAGVSNFSVEMLDRCQAVRPVDCVQPELNLLRPDALVDVIPWSREHGAAAISYSPLASGMLSDPGNQDRIATSSQESRRGLSIDAIRALVSDLQSIADLLGTTVTVLSVSWVVQMAGVTGAICGARTPEQVEGWLPAGDLELDAATLRAIADALERAGIN